eukprot:CAMPEP_0172164032 /NCGR_PEP_ID=MMETSP1050-20130122/7614_1 /TAXON_ID=233186 /ORGANISM="Cryptomonas curvata, Strain CCAP979/52" /LENGTH=52 /DNA_ID=CAMNT_0012834313 /DNA_START=401 /DNA_END=556 /DNA_ORIENTATION=+
MASPDRALGYMQFADGSKYAGQVLPKTDTKHGRGVTTRTNGTRHDGEYRHGK